MACCGPQTHDHQPALFHKPPDEIKKDHAEADPSIAIKFYVEICDKYRCKPNAGVIVCVRYKTTTFKASRNFSDIDMLALADLMLAFPKHVRHVIVIDLSYSRVAVHGAIALAEVLKVNHRIEAIHLHSLMITQMGAEAIAHALVTNRSVKYVDLRACRIGQKGGEHLAQLVIENDETVVREMDLSVNNIGNLGLITIRDAMNKRLEKAAQNDRIVPTVVDLEGNLVLEEVLNSVTHGIGIILCIVGTIYLLHRASEYGIAEHVAATMYSSSLLLLYTSSTLYHAFFCCKATNRIFQTLDHSAIYLLIAGTYTPVLILALADNEWSTPLLWFQWISCFMGLCFEFYEFTGKVQVTLLMYVVMGWSILICFEDLNLNVPENGIFWLVAGGVFYTGGVPFFLSQRHMAHVIWHMFVLAGSFCQWWAVYHYIMPLDLRNSRGENIELVRTMAA
mmetsp:Transcript_158/g.215  ORF Transcript_158/g.215 Transcript_158/m.215 type:complete len:450 (-) Transcript_158:287-1636(-)